MNRLAFWYLLFYLSFLCSVSSLIFIPEAPRRVVKILKVSNGGFWGGWGPPQYCAEGTYATGYSVKIEANQGRGDDTSLNSIALICKDLDAVRPGGKITSSEGGWGTWYGEVTCHEILGSPSFLTAFVLQVERPLDHGDDTAANYVKFKCRDFADTKRSYELTAPPGKGLYGQMGSWSSSCPPNSAICGLKTRVEHDLNRGDDTAFNNVEFYCCEENYEAGK